MDPWLFVFGAMIVVPVLVVVYLKIMGYRVMIVPQEERVVIYHLGNFSRLAGPGIVLLNRFDTEERRINVRSEVEDYRTNAYYFINGVPFNYTVRFWWRNDLKTAAAGNKERLAELSQYDDYDRERQLRTKLHEAMYDSVQRIKDRKQYQVDDNASIAAKLLPILPGMPGCDELLGFVENYLHHSLPSIGATLDRRHPLIIANVHVTPEVLASFTRGRSLTMLREQFHDVAPDLLMQAFAAIEGLDMKTVRLYMEGDAAVRDIRMEGNSITGYKISPQPVVEEVQRPEIADSPLRKVAVPANNEEERLSKADLSVLKRLPPNSAQRIAS